MPRSIERLFTAWGTAGLSLLLLSGCGDEGNRVLDSEEAPGGATFELAVWLPAAVGDEAGGGKYAISAADMDTLRGEVLIGEDRVVRAQIEGVPPGSGRQVRLVIYDRAGKPIYSGTARVDVGSGERVQLDMVLRPSVVVFTDRFLEGAVRRAIDKPRGEIRDQDVMGLTRLSQGRELLIDVEEPVRSLAGIEYLSQLRELEIVGSRLRDLTPLVYLSHLEVLSIGSLAPLDPTPLVNLPQLKTLGLGNRVLDLSLLAFLHDLDTLKIGTNEPPDLRPLASLKQLKRLVMSSDEPPDLRPLASLSSLEDLWIGRSRLRDLGPLADLRPLERLDLRENQIRDLRPLASLRRLKRLVLFRNQIRDLRPLASLRQLEELVLFENQIDDVSPLVSLTQLRMLDLSKNQIVDVTPLVANEGLGAGDLVLLFGNPLSEEARAVQIPALRERGVRIEF